MLIINSYKINDGNTGFANGNGNGIPENGETIELMPFIKNIGVGKAIQVNLTIASINSQIDIKRKNAIISHIMPKQTSVGNLVFSIPRLFLGDEIKADITASDVRGASEVKKIFTITTVTHQPILAYNYKIIDSNKDGLLENGEEGEIEILLSNKGVIEARSIRVDLDSDDISFSNSSSIIERIASVSSHVPLRFFFKVPRTFQTDSLNIRIQLNQKDFPGITEYINIPIKLIHPDFTITHQILDQNHNGIIEQGETIALIAKVRNIGKLDAENVVISMDIAQKGIILNGNKTITIGKLAAGTESEPQQFSIHVQRRAKPEDLPVYFTISQKDFPNKGVSISLNIAPEEAEVITIAGKEGHQKAFPLVPSISSYIPPVIVIALPKNNKRTASEFEMLTAKVVDDKGIASIEIIVNGRRLDATRSVGGIKKADQDHKERELRVKIPLQLGKNEITIMAFDIENLSRSESITVFREAECGEIWAAVIGINQYKNSQIPPLKYARNDAQAFAEYLRENIGIESNHLFEFYDEEATKLNITSLLGTKLSRKANRPEDTVFIFFAGHGAPEKDPQNKDGDGISKYILTYDSDPQDFYATAIPMDRIAEIFARIGAERVVFIADSCYSGGSGGRTILAKGQRATLSDAFLERIIQTGRGRIILTSSNTNEVSQESDELKHGYFTYYLLKGLKGAADLDADKLIDIDEIYRYLNKWVPDKTNGAQHPVKKGEAEGQLIVGRLK